MGVTTIGRFESGLTTPTLAVLRRAFEAGVVVFIPETGGGPGVRLRKAKG